MPRASKLCSALVATALVPATLAATSVSASAVGSLTNDEFEARTVYWINRYRAERGLQKVQDGGCLDSFAESWAAKLRDADTLYHQDLQKILDKCSSLSWTGEVLARGGEACDPKGWVDDWMASDVRVDADGRRVVVGDLGDLR